MENDSQKPSRFLVWGEHGWIAGHLISLLRSQGKDVHGTSIRMQDTHAIRGILEEVNPDCVINCAGKTGRPNVDWCEDHKVETVDTNVVGTLNVARGCAERGIHCTVLATGCIYSSTYSADRTKLISAPFKETDPPNFKGSWYSETKAYAEAMLKQYPGVLILRLRMPVSDDLHPRSFVTKIRTYPKVVNVPNSHSMLHDLLPMVVALSEHRETGVLNFTNPGAASHNEVLEMYRDIVDPGYSWQNFSLEEQAKVIKADRSNCELDSAKLLEKVEQYRAEGYEVDVPEIHESYRACFERMKVIEQSRGGGASAWSSQRFV